VKNLVVPTLVVLAIGTAPFASAFQPNEEQPVTPLTSEGQKTELAKLRAIFASVDKLPPRNARWVEVQAGSATGKTWHKGWLLRESDHEIQLLNEQGWKESLDKKKLAAKRPPAEFQWSDAWAVRNADFPRYCRDFLVAKKKVKDIPHEPGAYRFQRELAAADAAVVDSARLACWASVTGNEELARQLLKRAVDRLQKRRSTYIGLPTSNQVHQFVADNTFPHSRENLSTRLDEQDQDLPKARLLWLEWKQALAKIPYRSDHDAILRRIKQLKGLIAEDKAWKEPTREQFARLDARQKAAYWLYHLRNLNVTQTSSPGMCSVLTDSRSFLHSQDLGKKGKPNPAVELKKLGYEVLPQIIAHLDDDRPTRCVGFWRHYAPDSYYTLTYGDCCQQIFEAIALHSTGGDSVRLLCLRAGV
jgi:hypothetical protein